jgi:Ca2+-binding EF-hand superfamily protein
MKLHCVTFCAIVFTAVALKANPNDLNGDKRISREEFETFQRKGAKTNNQKFDPEQAKRLFEDKDSDGNGFLSYPEFARNPVDQNDDKVISFEEFSIMMKKRAERSGRVLKDGWIKEMFGKKDADGNGSLTYKELAQPVQ